MTAKKQASKPKKPVATRIGRLISRHGPGTAVKLGRLAKKATIAIGHQSVKLKDGLVEGWEEVTEEEAKEA